MIRSSPVNKILVFVLRSLTYGEVIDSSCSISEGTDKWELLYEVLDTFETLDLLEDSLEKVALR